METPLSSKQLFKRPQSQTAVTKLIDVEGLVPRPSLEVSVFQAINTVRKNPTVFLTYLKNYRTYFIDEEEYEREKKLDDGSNEEQLTPKKKKGGKSKASKEKEKDAENTQQKGGSKNVLRIPGHKDIVRTKEGVTAVDEAIEFLKKQKPVPPLRLSEGLSKAAKILVDTSGPKGDTGHVNKKGEGMDVRAEKFGEWVDTIGENIHYGEYSETSAGPIIMDWVIDDGVDGRGHRMNLFNDSFTVVGISVGSHAKFGSMCVATFVGDYVEPESETRKDREVEIIEPPPYVPQYRNNVESINNNNFDPRSGKRGTNKSIVPSVTDIVVATPGKMEIVNLERGSVNLNDPSIDIHTPTKTVETYEAFIPPNLIDKTPGMPVSVTKVKRTFFKSSTPRPRRTPNMFTEELTKKYDEKGISTTVEKRKRGSSDFSPSRKSKLLRTDLSPDRSLSGPDNGYQTPQQDKSWFRKIFDIFT